MKLTKVRATSTPDPSAGDDRRDWRIAAVVAGLLVGCAATVAAPPAFAEDDGPPVAISSRASPDYVRTRLANGSLQQETFAFAKGGVWSGAEAGTADMLDFMKVARAIAGPLASQSYVSARDPSTTRLMIMVYWGTTRTPEHSSSSTASQVLQDASAAALAANHPQGAHFNDMDSCAPAQLSQASTTSYAIRDPSQIDADNAMTSALAMAAAEDHQRNQLDAKNANMLGYDSSLVESASYAGTPLEVRRRDLLDELEARRYFVVLMAYDFQMIWKQKKAKLLWETRFSISEQGNDFSKELEAMAATAASYFGRNTGTLVHKTMPEGHVEVGPIRTLAQYSPQK
jgi:hypothetical protein